MKRYRIATLMTVTLYFAIGLGALNDPEPRQARIWISTIYTLTAFILMTSTLMAFIQGGRDRLGWIGFSIFGWAYLLLLGFEVTDWLNKPRLLTTCVLEMILHSTSRYAFAHSSATQTNTFSTVGHAIFALLFGLTGALLGRSLTPILPLRAQDSSENRQPNGAPHQS